jgi:hypothetical protein
VLLKHNSANAHLCMCTVCTGPAASPVFSYYAAHYMHSTCVRDPTMRTGWFGALNHPSSKCLPCKNATYPASCNGFAGGVLQCEAFKLTPCMLHTSQPTTTHAPQAACVSKIMVERLAELAPPAHPPRLSHCTQPVATPKLCVPYGCFGCARMM